MHKKQANDVKKPVHRHLCELCTKQGQWQTFTSLSLTAEICLGIKQAGRHLSRFYSREGRSTRSGSCREVAVVICIARPPTTSPGIGIGTCSNGCVCCTGAQDLAVSADCKRRRVMVTTTRCGGCDRNRAVPVRSSCLQAHWKRALPLSFGS